MQVDLLPLLAIGAGSGLLAGLCGFAGGIVVVPALTWFYGAEALRAAIVASWFCVLINSAAAAASHWRLRTARERSVLLTQVRWFLVGITVATPLIALAATSVKGLLSAGLVATLQLVLAGLMLAPVSQVQGARGLHPMRDASMGGMVGAVSALIGVGGGAYTIAYMVRGCGSDLREAIAAANLTGLAIGALSVCGFVLSVGLFGSAALPASPVSNTGIAVLVLAGAVAAPVGAALTRRMPIRVLRSVLVLALVASALRLLLA